MLLAAAALGGMAKAAVSFEIILAKRIQYVDLCVRFGALTTCLLVCFLLDGDLWFIGRSL